MQVNSNFEWRLLTDEEIANILVPWWEKHKFPPVHLDYLSRTGIMVSKNGIDLYAGFVYYTQTAWGLLEFVVSNPSRESVQYKRGALERLVDIASVLSKEKGVKALFISTNNKGFRNQLLKSGFLDGDSDTYQLVKNL